MKTTGDGSVTIDTMGQGRGRGRGRGRGYERRRRYLIAMEAKKDACASSRRLVWGRAWSSKNSSNRGWLLEKALFWTAIR